MPSVINSHIEHMNDLRPYQDELLQLADLAGVHMDKQVFR